MLEQLLNSDTRTRILSLFFQNPERAFYSQEVVRKAGTDAANTHRELARLAELSVLKARKQGKQKFFELDRSNPYFEGLQKVFSIYHREQHKDAWFPFEDFPNAYPLACADFFNLKRANDFFKEIGFRSRLSRSLSVYKDGQVYLYFIKQEFDRLSQEVVDGIVAAPERMLEFNREVIKRSDALLAVSRQVLNTNLSALTDKQLLGVFVEMNAAYEYAHISGWPQNVADFGEGLFSKFLIKSLKAVIGKSSAYKVNDVFVKLTTPLEASNAQKEYVDLMEIVEYIRSSARLRSFFKTTETRIIMEQLPGLDKKLSDRISRHALKYGYLGYGFVGPVWGREYFVDILGSLVRQESQVIHEESFTELERIQKQIIKDLKIGKELQKAFEVARGFVFTKGYRKDSMFYYFWVLEQLLREIGKRKYLSIKQMRFVYAHEMANLILRDLFDVNELNDRFRNSIYYSSGGDYQDDTILTGSKAEKFIESFKFIKEDIEGIKQLNGDCASPGKVRGVCRIINVSEDMEKMQQGDVLVSIVTSPELVPAIKKSAAIVTNAGGITCHAAIISRELGIPCVIGTKIATKILKDGDLVEVDASHGKVTIIKE